MYGFYIAISLYRILKYMIGHQKSEWKEPLDLFLLEFTQNNVQMNGNQLYKSQNVSRLEVSINFEPFRKYR